MKKLILIMIMIFTTCSPVVYERGVKTLKVEITTIKDGNWVHLPVMIWSSNFVPIQTNVASDYFVPTTKSFTAVYNQRDWITFEVIVNVANEVKTNIFYMNNNYIKIESQLTFYTN